MRLDTRNIRHDGKGIYLGRTEIVKGSSLCDFCSIQDACKVKTTEQRERCDQFVMALSFSPEASKGLSGTFSTFRSSRVWHDRAQSVIENGGLVGLYNTQTCERFGYAKITKVVLGPFCRLMQEHAHTNHLSVEAGIPQNLAAEWLSRKIRNLAGPRYVKTPNQISTVIYVSTEETSQREKAAR